MGLKETGNPPGLWTSPELQEHPSTTSFVWRPSFSPDHHLIPSTPSPVRPPQQHVSFDELLLRVLSTSRLRWSSRVLELPYPQLLINEVRRTRRHPVETQNKTCQRVSGNTLTHDQEWSYVNDNNYVSSSRKEKRQSKKSEGMKKENTRGDSI